MTTIIDIATGQEVPAKPRDRGMLFLDAAGIGESLVRAGGPGYWMSCYGQHVEHFESDIRHAYKRLGECIANLDAYHAQAAKEPTQADDDLIAEIF